MKTNNEATGGLKEHIAAELEKFAKGKIVESNAIRRLREVSKRLNSLIGQCHVEINGVPLSQEEISKIKHVLPPCLREQQWTYTATASANGKETAKLVLEVTG